MRSLDPGQPWGFPACQALTEILIATSPPQKMFFHGIRDSFRVLQRTKVRGNKSIVQVNAT